MKNIIAKFKITLGVLESHLNSVFHRTGFWGFLFLGEVHGGINAN
jgi:hypothetical protein